MENTIGHDGDSKPSLSIRTRMNAFRNAKARNRVLCIKCSETFCKQRFFSLPFRHRNAGNGNMTFEPPDCSEDVAIVSDRGISKETGATPNQATLIMHLIALFPSAPLPEMQVLNADVIDSWVKLNRCVINGITSTAPLERSSMHFGYVLR